MKNQKKTDARTESLAARLMALVVEEGILEGTVTTMKSGNSTKTTFTDKVNGKTRCLYVPQRHLEEVERLSGNWREAKAILKELSDIWREDLVPRIKRQPKDCQSSSGAKDPDGLQKQVRIRMRSLAKR